MCARNSDTDTLFTAASATDIELIRKLFEVKVRACTSVRWTTIEVTMNEGGRQCRMTFVVGFCFLDAARRTMKFVSKPAAEV